MIHGAFIEDSFAFKICSSVSWPVFIFIHGGVFWKVSTLEIFAMIFNLTFLYIDYILYISNNQFHSYHYVDSIHSRGKEIHVSVHVNNTTERSTYALHLHYITEIRRNTQLNSITNYITHVFQYLHRQLPLHVANLHPELSFLLCSTYTSVSVSKLVNLFHLYIVFFIDETMELRSSLSYERHMFGNHIDCTFDYWLLIMHISGSTTDSWWNQTLKSTIKWNPEAV
jgi:hypothetical protein